MCSPNETKPDHLIQRKLHSPARRKLWQIEPSLHCSVIGTCLSMKELRRFHQKFKLDASIATTDYALHRYFVRLVKCNTYQSKYINKALDQKYQSTLRKFSRAKSDQVLKALWDEAVGNGTVAEAYWALITHPAVSESLRDTVYADVHMLSHLSGATIRIDMQKHYQLQQLTRTLRQQIAASKTSLKSQTAANNRLDRQLSSQLNKTRQLEEKYAQLSTRLQELQDVKIISDLRKKLDVYKSKVTSQQDYMDRLQANVQEWKDLAMQSDGRYRDLRKEHVQQKAERDILESTIEELLNQQSAGCFKQQECQPDSNLCGRCILYVGGRNRQCAHFRTVVERQNGQFLHHDGGLNDGHLRLGSLLPQVDAVFCPLDCVSHEAMYKIKKYCKQHSKKLVWLPRSSLAAFMRGLNEVSNNEHV